MKQIYEENSDFVATLVALHTAACSPVGAVYRKMLWAGRLFNVFEKSLLRAFKCVQFLGKLVGKGVGPGGPGVDY